MRRPWALALVFALFGGSLVVEYLALERHFHRQVRAVENYTGAFYCSLAVDLATGGISGSPDDVARRWLQDRLRTHLLVYASIVRESPSRYHLGDVNLLAKCLQRYADVERGSDPAVEEVVQALRAALQAWSQAHPEEARDMRYKIE